ncbi:MAG: hypothetical protein GX620_14710, partial [Chloroflexi bacterium]|nr:hypothetical protein [Chloroflexota bacterium]
MRSISTSLTAVILTTLLAAACDRFTETSPPAATTVMSTATSAPVETVIPTDTPPPSMPKELTICQAEEPNTLFLYGEPSRAARNVLEAIYDGPIDVNEYQFKPVILEKLPSLTDGDAAVRQVPVTSGVKVANAEGALVDLAPGITVVDAAGQTVIFEGGEISMAQIVVTFTLRSDVRWADGTPVTADDSRYSFELAGQLDSPVRQWTLDRSLSYEVIDARTVVWTGVPGHQDTFYFLNFWTPLPRHIWGATSIEQLSSTEVAHKRPLGWGPFAVDEWVDGEYVSLVRNPYYFRASEGLPYLDRITFRFVADFQQALDDLLSGECDVVGRDLIERRVFENGDLAPLLEAADTGRINLVQSSSSEWEHLDFGITPADSVHRPDFFGDVRVRRAIAMCIHRERIAGEAFPYGAAELATSYVAADHPLYARDHLHYWDYNPSEALNTLDQVGWRDQNGDGIREAYGVPGIADGTPFTVTLLTTANSLAHERTARILAENLASCGIGLSVQYMSDDEFFADGPIGPIFGRQFDLALFSWMNDFDAHCGLYLSSQIPDT